MINIRKANPDTLQAYFDARLANRDTQREMAAIMAECAAPKLRSRAERDRELLAVVLSATPEQWRQNGGWQGVAQLVEEQCGEPAAEEPAELQEPDPGPAERRNSEAGKALCSTGYREEVRISAALLCLQMDIAAGKALYREHEGWSSRNPEPAELDLSEHEVCSCEEAERLRAQLPEGMQNCTIKFIECPVGHGTLTATNWVQGPCRQCHIVWLRDKIEEAIGWAKHQESHDSVDRAIRILRGALK